MAGDCEVWRGEVKTRRFLAYPLVLLLLVFLLDKIFLLPVVKTFVKSDFTFIYYESREELFDALVKEQQAGQNKKDIMLILGSSRLLYFDAEDLADYYPEWNIYNFSSAVTTPAYYLYYLEKILDKGIRPKMVLLETAPNQFNASSSVFRESNLTYSFDLPFLLKYASLFGKDYLSFYMGNLLFAVGKNKPNLSNVYKRITHPDKKAILDMEKKLRKYLVDNKGNALSPVEDYVEKDAAILGATSRRTVDWLYSSYRHSEMQEGFYHLLLERLEKEKIPVIVVHPYGAYQMQAMEDGLPVIEDWKKRVYEITESYGFQVHDLREKREDFFCNSFVDGGHMSKDCYHPFMRYVMAEHYKMNN